MITANGYSKDPSILPEGIALTLPVKFFEERGMNHSQFKKYFERFMRNEDAIWNFRLTNLPLHDIAWVFFIFDGFIQYRLNFVMYERGVAKSFKDSVNGGLYHFPPSNWVLTTGPASKPPYDWPQKGFQGFRYTTKLF